MSNRIEKVNSLLQHEIGNILLRDFGFSPEVLVTLTRVDTSANMIETKAYISVFPETKSEGVINALNKSVYDIQYKINRTLKMRPIPKIRFVKETEVSKAARIEELLAKVSDDIISDDTEVEKK